MATEITYVVDAETGLLAPAPSEGGDRVGSGLADALGVAATNQNLDHCADGLSKLLAVFTDKPRLDALICSFLDQTQDLETALWALFTERTLDASVGVQLDGLGAIVGEPRKARTDDDYRQFIKVRILVNRSNGQIGELYAILLAMLGDTAAVGITEHYPAAIVAEVLSDIGTLSAVDIHGMLMDAKAAGVRLETVVSYDASSDLLIFNSALADQALGSTLDAGLGGNLTSVIG